MVTCDLGLTDIYTCQVTSRESWDWRQSRQFGLRQQAGNTSVLVLVAIAGYLYRSVSGVAPLPSRVAQRCTAISAAKSTDYGGKLRSKPGYQCQHGI